MFIRDRPAIAHSLFRPKCQLKAPGPPIQLWTRTHSGFCCSRSEPRLAKGKHMAFQDVQYRGQCPICYREITLASIEPYINNSGLEIHNYKIHNFKCERCGPVISEIVANPAQFAA